MPGKLKDWLQCSLNLLQHADPSGSTGEQPKVPQLSVWGVRLKRTSAIILFCAATYFAVGSWLYGAWWYGFLWGGKALDKHYVTGGVFFLLDHKATSVIFVLLLIACIVIYFIIRKNWILPFLDRKWGWVVFASAFSILVTSVVIHKTYKREYAVYDAATILLANVGELVDALGKDEYPTITPPVPFKYLDKPALDSLYSQIIPELVEKERSVETSDKRQLKAGASAHGISGELGTEKGSQTKSILTRVDFSPERKCIELINYSLTERRAGYYANAEVWFAHKALKELSDKFDQVRKDPEHVKPNLFDTDFSAQAVETRKLEARHKYSSNLIQEMTSLSGLLLLRGEFAVSQQDGKEIILRHPFSDGDPRKIVFVVTVAAALPYTTGEKIRQLNIFARVDQPLDEKGEIRAHAIAIF